MSLTIQSLSYSLPFQSNDFRIKKRFKNVEQTSTLMNKSQRMIRRKHSDITDYYVGSNNDKKNTHMNNNDFKRDFSRATLRQYHENEDRKVFVYSPPPLYDPYVKIEEIDNTNLESNQRQEKELENKDKNDNQKSQLANKFKGKLHRKLRSQYKFLFKPYNPNVDTSLASTMSWKDKKQRKERKKQAKKKVVISPKLERWKHPDVHTSEHSTYYKEMIKKKKHHTMISPLKKRIRGIPATDTEFGNTLLSNIVKETDKDGTWRYIDATQTTPGINTNFNKTQTLKTQEKLRKLKQKEDEDRPPSRLNEQLREETLSKIRTKFVYNRFDWNSSGRFVPSHHPFNPRLYSNAERIYTINAKKIEKPELIAKHAPKVNKKQVKQRKMVFGAPPGFGSRLPANATSPKIVPYKNDTAFTLGERLEMGWNMVGENHELRIDKTEMAAAEARKNADWHGKYKPLNNKEFHSFVMSRRKRSGGATS